MRKCWWVPVFYQWEQQGFNEALAAESLLILQQPPLLCHGKEIFIESFCIEKLQIFWYNHNIDALANAHCSCMSGSHSNEPRFRQEGGVLCMPCILPSCLSAAQWGCVRAWSSDGSCVMHAIRSPPVTDPSASCCILVRHQNWQKRRDSRARGLWNIRNQLFYLNS